MRHPTLLRGVNVGGARPLPMRELAEAFTAAGAMAAATVIQKADDGAARHCADKQRQRGDDEHPGDDRPGAS